MNYLIPFLVALTVFGVDVRQANALSALTSPSIQSVESDSDAVVQSSDSTALAITSNSPGTSSFSSSSSSAFGDALSGVSLTAQSEESESQYQYQGQYQNGSYGHSPKPTAPCAVPFEGAIWLLSLGAAPAVLVRIRHTGKGA